jgi:hypothetical protein
LQVPAGFARNWFQLELVKRNFSAFSVPNIDLAQGIVGFHGAWQPAEEHFAAQRSGVREDTQRVEEDRYRQAHPAKRSEPVWQTDEVRTLICQARLAFEFT